MVQAILKNDANKEAVDFITQVGADEIIPWQSQHSIGKIDDKSLSKWQTVARESSRQSRRVRIPLVTIKGVWGLEGRYQRSQKYLDLQIFLLPESHFWKTYKINNLVHSTDNHLPYALVTISRF